MTYVEQALCGEMEKSFSAEHGKKEVITKIKHFAIQQITDLKKILSAL